MAAFVAGVEKDEEKGGKNFRDNRKAEGKNRRERERNVGQVTKEMCRAV